MGNREKEHEKGYTDMENRLTRILRYADNLAVLSKGVADIYPEAEGAILAISDAIRKEADDALDAYIEEKKQEGSSVF